MSTASKSSEPAENRAGQYAKFDEYVDFQISKTGSNIKANDLLTTGVGITTIFLGYLLIFVVFDHWIIKGGFGHTSRLLMLAGVVLACLGWAVWKLIIPYFKKVTRLYSAHSLEKTSEEMEGSLLNLIDLKKSNRPVNPEIISTLEKKAALTLSKADTDQAIDRRPLMNLSYSLLIVVALLCFYALFSPKEIWPSVSAAMTFSAQREFATQTQINSVTPGNTEVLSGSQLEVIVDLRGDVPEKVMLFYTSRDHGRVDEPIALRSMDDTLKRYQGVIVGVNGRGIRQELTYHIEAGDAVSDDYQVKVIQPPSATVHSVRYEYPQYMDLSGVNQPGGAIDAWEGTKVTVDATTNMPISSFEVLFSDKEDTTSLLEEFKIEKTISKNTITASWTLKLRTDRSSPRFYQIKCRNEAGQTTLSPTVYPLMIRPDLSPEITLLSPKQDLKMPANGTIPISVVASDPDFKIRYLNLRVEKEQRNLLTKILFEGAQKHVSLNQDFSLEPLRLTPGDTIFLWVEARDNKLPSGNRKNTPKIKIEIIKPVSKEEAKKQLQEQKKQLEQENQKQSADQQKNQPGNKQSKNSQAGNDSSKSKPDPSEKSKSGAGTKKGEQSDEGTDEKKQDPTGKQQPGSENPQKSEKPSTGENQQKPDNKGLDSDGTDDQEAIKKILDQLKKEGEEPQSDPEQKEPGSKKPDPENQSADPEMQGQNSKSSEDSTPSNSKSSPNPDGSPQGSENKNSQAQPSSKANQPDNKSSNQKPQSESGPIPDGKKESAPPSDNATKTKSKGEPGEKGTPDHDPNAKPEKSSKNIQRDPKDKPATRPGKNEPTDSKPKQGNQPDSQNQSPDKSNSATENKSQKGMRKPEKPDQNPSPTQKQKPTDGQNKKQNKKQKENQVDGSNSSPQGKNKPSEQKSKRPQEGKNGQSSQNDQGQSGSKQPGKGDSTGKKGNQEQGGQKKPSDSSKPMDQNNSQKKQGESSTSNGKSGAGKQGSESKSKGGGSKGQGQSKSGSKSGTGSSNGSQSDNPQGSSATNGGASAQEGNNPSGSAGDSGLSEADDANLEYGKEAANLVLKRIKDELKRKEVNQELLNELGWSKEEMKQFSERLQKQLQTPDSNQQTPESLARKRQFEEMLKSLKPASRAKNRNRTSTRKQTNDSLGPRRLPIPEEYREAYEAFSRGRADQKPVD